MLTPCFCNIIRLPWNALSQPVCLLPANVANLSNSPPPPLSFLLLPWEAELCRRKHGRWVGAELAFSPSWVTLCFLIMKRAHKPVWMVAASVSSQLTAASGLQRVWPMIGPRGFIVIIVI